MHNFTWLKSSTDFILIIVDTETFVNVIGKLVVEDISDGSIIAITQ